jgi:hypothetical protein
MDSFKGGREDVEDREIRRLEMWQGPEFFLGAFCGMTESRALIQGPLQDIIAAA